MDFNLLKQIPLPEVLAKYGIPLTYSGNGWAKTRCPLPTHKEGDRDKNFNVCLEKNTWNCWSESCKAKSGCEYGDTINFVALKENLSQGAAAKKLAQMFNINEKTAPHIEARPNQNTTSKGTDSNHDSPTIVVKGFMHETGLWLEELLTPIVPDLNIRKDLKKALQNKIHESFRNGKAQRA